MSYSKLHTVQLYKPIIKVSVEIVNLTKPSGFCSLYTYECFFFFLDLELQIVRAKEAMWVCGCVRVHHHLNIHVSASNVFVIETTRGQTVSTHTHTLVCTLP